MNFKVILKNGQTEYRAVDLRTWDGKQYSQDFFAELDMDARELPVEKGSDCRIIYENQYEELIGWWKEECDRANNGVWTETFGDYNKEEQGELVFSAD